MTPCGWGGNRRSGVALAMRCRLQWFIHLLDHGLRKEVEYLACIPHRAWQTVPLPFISMASYFTFERQVSDRPTWLQRVPVISERQRDTHAERPSYSSRASHAATYLLLRFDENDTVTDGQTDRDTRTAPNRAKTCRVKYVPQSLHAPPL